MNERGKKGTCQEMCPIEEFKNRQPNPFECDSNGEFKLKLAIKQFHRSDAGQFISEKDLRPLPVLVKTLKHIINYVIGEKTNTSQSTSEIQMYYFVRDRLRSIRSDITVQSLKGAEIINIYETSTLFFIWAGTHFNMEDINDFDHKQNLEQITQTILSLNQLYDLYLLENHEHYPSEPFFRALDLISYLNLPGYMSKLLSFSEFVIKSNYVQAVIETKKALLTRDISLFLSILDRIPVQMASYILQNSRVIWETIGLALRRSFSQRPFPKTFLTDFLEIPKDIFDKWCGSFAISATLDNNLNYNTKSDIKMLLLPDVIVPDKFRLIQKFNNPTDFLFVEETISSFGTSSSSQQKNDFSNLTEPISLHEIKIIEDVDEKKEAAQPVAPTIEMNENEISEEQASNKLLAVPSRKVLLQEEPYIDQKNIPISPPEPEILEDEKKVSLFLDESNSSSHLFKIIPNRPNSTNPKLLKKDKHQLKSINRATSKKNLVLNNSELFEAKISIKDIMSMIPYKVPRISSACILFIANDQSYSSTFAESRFLAKSDFIILCEKFTSSSETCYILITKNIEQLGISSIIYCNDTVKPEFNSDINQNVPLVQFDAGFGFSPVLTFNSCLRKAIEQGIIEIKPFNLSDLVQNTFTRFIKAISYTSWQFASANAVFNFFNMGLVGISNNLVDRSFTKYILPFEHHELNFDDLKQYSENIKSMQFDLIENLLSKRPINGSNWPAYIKGRISISFPPFIIPLSSKFDQEKFISNIMRELPYQKPSETIYFS